jgi:hypothetical protein
MYIENTAVKRTDCWPADLARMQQVSHLSFGRKVFGQIFILDFRTKCHLNI